MKTKSFFIAIAFVASSFTSASAQELLVSEDFSSAAWQAELTRLNPGTEANPNCMNPNPYTTPEKGGNKAYKGINRKEKCFDKYQLFGAIETFPALPCVLGSASKHQNGNFAVALRLPDVANAQLQFHNLPTAGIITLHVRNGNKTEATQLGLEKLENGKWIPLHTFELQNNSAYKTIDEILTYDINSSLPIKLRLINNVSETKKWIYLFRVDIAAKQK